MNTRQQALAVDTRFGFLDGSQESTGVFEPRLIDNIGSNTMLKAIRHELAKAQHFTFSVAFVTPSALALLKQTLVDYQGTGEIVTSTYLGFNSPAVFRELLNLRGVQVSIYPEEKAFHAKGYLFEHHEHTTAIIGSSNLTQYALLKNHEWNLRFSALPDGDIVRQLETAVDAQQENATPLSIDWISAYEADYQARQTTELQRLINPTGPGLSARTGKVTPNSMQLEALQEIEALRSNDARRALVISATGTGKTILAALDVQAASPDRLLFIVHREQILDKAISEFKSVLGIHDDDIGKFAGGQKQLDRRFVFATVQAISRAENLPQIAAEGFDYVLIDEVHRAGAESYRKIIEALDPNFLLGLTATPERSDDFNVFELFDYNVAYEIRLQRALESDMLVPFHYFGVTDIRDFEGNIIDDLTSMNKLVGEQRVEHLIQTVGTYGHAGAPVKGLIFCSRIEEASALSAALNAREVHGQRLRTRALSGKDSISFRESTVEMLRTGQLDYILTVDIFNEGIDIPEVNQILMLRQTQSSIVFTQQLGRGLRKAPRKEHLIVIDFIGNYTNNYLIPIALFGDSTLSKDSIRKKMIEAQESGTISGFSSVNFDQIAREQIFRSLAAVNLNSMQNLKRSFAQMEQRLGTIPKLMDFARFDTVDPTIIATKQQNYWNFLNKVKAVESVPTVAEAAILTFLSSELLNGKRPHELLLVEALLKRGQLSHHEFRTLLDVKGCTNDDATIQSTERILSLEFFTASERAKYGDAPVIEKTGLNYSFTPRLATLLEKSPRLRQHADDVIQTGLYRARHHYDWAGGLSIGQRYSRKDVCRLLNWQNNEYSTIYGYKVDHSSQTCPIFITYHKTDDVSASTKYGDEFLSHSALHWFTRSKRTLQSAEVQTIVANRVPLHLFAKKDDAEGSEFFYLGQAESRDPRQAKMPNDHGKLLDVVTMTLDFKSPLEQSLYDYLVAESLPAPRP